MRKLRTSTVVLLVGLLLLTVGLFINASYEDARGNGYEVEAEVTRKKVHESTDAGFDDTYTYYGTYEINGKVYKDKKLGAIADGYEVGDTVRIVVNPDDPGSQLPEGGFLGTVGLVLTVGSLIYRHKEKKARQAKSAETQ